MYPMYLFLLQLELDNPNFFDEKHTNLAEFCIYNQTEFCIYNKIHYLCNMNTYLEHKKILDDVKSIFQPGVTFDNTNIGGSTTHTVSKDDRFAMQGVGNIVLGINGKMAELK
jgi:hypothetical protein